MVVRVYRAFTSGTMPYAMRAVNFVQLIRIDVRSCVSHEGDSRSAGLNIEEACVPTERRPHQLSRQR